MIILSSPTDTTGGCASLAIAALLSFIRQHSSVQSLEKSLASLSDPIFKPSRDSEESKMILNRIWLVAWLSLRLSIDKSL